MLRVESPSLFWVRLNHGSERYDAMMAELQVRRNRRPSILAVDDLSGSTAVVTAESGGQWERGILSRTDCDNWSYVFLRDRGMKVRRDWNEVFRLPNAFRVKPWQAVPCCLANTAPVHTVAGWTSATSLLTRFLLEDRRVTVDMQMSTTNRRGAYVDVYLHQARNQEIVNLRELLIERGLATYWRYIIPPVWPSIEECP